MEEPPADEQPRPPAAADSAEGDPREWTGAQVASNTDRILLGHLDEEFADNPEPEGADWDRPDDEDHGPQEEEGYAEQEPADVTPRERLPLLRSQRTTQTF